jgi:hypothetical protein
MDFELFRKKSAKNRLISALFWHACPGSNRGPRAWEQTKNGIFGSLNVAVF